MLIWEGNREVAVFTEGLKQAAELLGTPSGKRHKGSRRFLGAVGTQKRLLFSISLQAQVPSYPKPSVTLLYKTLSHWRPPSPQKGQICPVQMAPTLLEGWPGANVRI